MKLKQLILIITVFVIMIFTIVSCSEGNGTEYRGTNEGSKLASRADLWTDGNLENNTEFGSSSFAFPPGGGREGNYGYFFGIAGISGDF